MFKDYTTCFGHVERMYLAGRRERNFVDEAIDCKSDYFSLLVDGQGKENPRVGPGVHRFIMISKGCSVVVTAKVPMKTQSHQCLYTYG